MDKLNKAREEGRLRLNSRIFRWAVAVKEAIEMEELKAAMIHVIQNSKAKSAIELFSEIIHLLYLKGFIDGQEYAVDSKEELVDKILENDDAWR